MSTLNQRESSILEAALRLPPKERAAYLDRACGGDAQLRQRIVEALFQAVHGEFQILRMHLAQASATGRS